MQDKANLSVENDNKDIELAAGNMRSENKNQFNTADILF